MPSQALGLGQSGIYDDMPTARRRGGQGCRGGGGQRVSGGCSCSLWERKVGLGLGALATMAWGCPRWAVPYGPASNRAGLGCPASWSNSPSTTHVLVWAKHDPWLLRLCHARTGPACACRVLAHLARPEITGLRSGGIPDNSSEKTSGNSLTSRTSCTELTSLIYLSLVGCCLTSGKRLCHIFQFLPIFYGQLHNLYIIYYQSLMLAEL
jgi:hypothetical protein